MKSTPAPLAPLLLLPLFLAAPLAAEQLDYPPGSAEWNSLYDPAYPRPQEIPAGTDLRKQLFDSLRPALQQRVDRPILFRGSLTAYRNWALFVGDTVDQGGRTVAYPPIDNSDTVALWLRTRGGWVLVDFEGGHSDVFYLIWAEKYGVPKRLLGVE